MAIVTSYLKLSIHRQIQIGVFSVSFCVGILVLSLICINSFIVVNRFYADILSELYFKENDVMDEISKFFDVRLNLMAETSKYGIQGIRNFINLNTQNKEFIGQMTNLNQNYLINLDKNEKCPNTECIYYKQLGDISSQMKDSYSDFLKIMTISIPLLKQTFKRRFYDLPNTEIFKSFHLISNTFNSVFYFQNREFNKNYTIDTLKNSVNTISLEIASNYVNKTLPLNPFMNETFKSNISTILYNPVMTTFIKGIDNYYFPWALNTNDTSKLVTISTKYKNSAVENLNATYENLKNSFNIDDFLILEWSYDSIDEYSYKSVSIFKGHTVIVTKNDLNQSVISQFSCKYFLKYYNLQNPQNILNLTNTYFLNSCFQYKEMKNNVIKYFIKDSNLKVEKSRDSRKLRLKVFNDYFDREQTTIGVFYKIFRLSVPNLKTFLTFDFTFYPNYEMNSFLFKNLNINLAMNNKLWITAIKFFTFIMFYNLALWFIVMIIIVFLIIKTTDKISKPISNLIKFVNTTHSDKNNLSLKDELDSINFEDDYDINNLFQICKALIQGGFINSHKLVDNKKKLNKFSKAYNNISYVKSNNLIIDEKVIYYFNKNSISLFSYQNFNNQNDKELDKISKPQSDFFIINKFTTKRSNTIEIKSKYFFNNLKLELTISQSEKFDYNLDKDFIQDLIIFETTLEKGSIYHAFISNTNTGKDIRILKFNFNDVFLIRKI